VGRLRAERFPVVTPGLITGVAFDPCNTPGPGTWLFRAHGVDAAGTDIYSDPFPYSVSACVTDRGEVRGDGRLDTNPLTRFVFHNVKSDGTSPASGQISFTDRAADPRLHFESTAITTLVIAGTHVKLTGTGTANGLPTDSVVEGDDGSPDRVLDRALQRLFSSRRGRLRAGG
jgi:hypothetical protein